MLVFGRKSRRTVVWLVVIGSHTVAIFWLWHSDEFIERGEEVLIVELALTRVPPPAEPAPARPATPRRRREPPPAAARDVPPAMAPVATPVSPGKAPDWRAAAELSAQRVLSGEGDGRRDFTSIPESPYRDCLRKPNNFEWKPDAKRTGWSGGLPYVRMGRRCVVGLGFFGCIADPELPPADGTLLEDMNTINRMDGTVPGVQDCVMPEK
jgi:hypothetical protein